MESDILVNTVSINSLLPVQPLAYIWTNDDLLLIRPIGTKFDEFQTKIKQFH